MEKKWCGYHQKMEPVSKFALNAFKESGLQDHCKEAQNTMVKDYYDRNKELCSKKSSIYHKWYSGEISTEQKNRMVTKLNAKYGVKTRV